MIEPNPYGIQRKRKGRSSDIDDPVLRSEIIACASSGASRRTVAAMVGKPESTIRRWIERGMAYPDEEPFGSFSDQYRRAERGLAMAIAQTSALRVQLLSEQLQQYMRWRDRGPPPLKPIEPAKLGRKGVTEEMRQEHRERVHQYERDMQFWQVAYDAWSQPPPSPDVADMMWMERIREARHPDDYGTSKHRKPDAEHSADNYLEAHSMEREQLSALFADPPEPIRLAIVDSGAQVYAILIAAGFDPAAPPARKAESDEQSTV